MSDEGGGGIVSLPLWRKTIIVNWNTFPVLCVYRDNVTIATISWFLMSSIHRCKKTDVAHCFVILLPWLPSLKLVLVLYKVRIKSDLANMNKTFVVDFFIEIQSIWNMVQIEWQQKDCTFCKFYNFPFKIRIMKIAIFWPNSISSL